MTKKSWTNDPKVVAEWNAETIAMIVKSGESLPIADAVPHIVGLYRAAKMAPPHVVVEVPSPVAAAFVWCVAAAWWELNPDAKRSGETACVQCGDPVSGSDRASIGFGWTEDAERFFELSGRVNRCSGPERIRTICSLLYGDNADAVADRAIAKSKEWRQDFQGGNEAASWSRFLDYCRVIGGVDIPEHKDFAHWSALCHWGPRFLHEKFAVVSRLPLERHFVEGEGGRLDLHRDDGPAVSYADGLKLWYVNGVKVDEQIVMNPQTQTIEQIRSEENAEVRRIRIERYGWEAYLDNAGAKVLDVRTNEIEQTKEALMDAGEDGRVLVCACPSTARVYAMRVPAEITTCAEAQRWLCPAEIRIVGAS